jgi:hypothetical protein
MKTSLFKTYVTVDGRVVSWRWARVPVVLWLMLVGTWLSAGLSLGRAVYLMTQPVAVRDASDFNLTVFLFLLCVAGGAVFGLVVYLLAKPEEPGND